jgi:hypothetical protein
MELLLGQHPCWTQAAGERYPTHLADAETNTEFAGHEERLQHSHRFVTPFELVRTFSRVGALASVDEEVPHGVNHVDVQVETYADTLTREDVPLDAETLR